MLRKLTNYRFDPFTALPTSTVITSEKHLVPSSGAYWVRLWECPDESYTEPTSGTPVYIRNSAAVDFTEVSTTPGANEFRVDYTYLTAWVEFNSANAGDVIYVNYRGTGSPVTIEDLNLLQWLGGAIATPVFLGDGSDGDVTISANTGLAATSDLVAIKQYTNLTIDAGKTLSANTGVYGLIIAVQGVLTLGNGSKITANAVGAQAAAGAMGAAGGYGGGGGGSNVAIGAGGKGGGLQQKSNNCFVPGAGYGGDGGAAGGSNVGEAGVKDVFDDAELWWRSFRHQAVYGAGGGGGCTGGGAGGRGGGFIIINANIIDSDAGAAYEAKGGDGAAGPGTGAGGGGAGGTIFILSYHEMQGETAANMQANDCDVSGGAGGVGGAANGGAGSDGLIGVVDGFYERNVF